MARIRRVAAEFGVFTLLAGCSAGSDPPGDPGPNFQPGGGGAFPVGGGGAGLVGAGNGGTTGGSSSIFIPGSSGGAAATGSGGLPAGSCGKATVQGETLTETRIEKRKETRTQTHTETREVTKPVGLYLMLDQSGSMIEQDKWGAAVRAINAFSTDARSAGFRVALNIFSVNLLGNPPGCSLCDGSDCRTPMVPWGELPAVAAPIATALNRVPIGIGTQIEAGLRGVTLGCKDYEAAHPAEDCVAVLITDGAPSGCDQTAAGLSAIAGTAAQGGVPTFAIGMAGADFALLDQVAASGGTDCDPTSDRRSCNANSAEEFRAALERIRTTVTQTQTIEVPIEVEVEVEVEVPVTGPIPCEWGIPPSQSTKELDLNAVNVDVTDRATQTKLELGKVSGLAECASFTNGWYYDDPVEPKRIIACPNVCENVKKFNAQVDIMVGCESRPPR
jgi:Mg-chelatase subunit ChlD